MTSDVFMELDAEISTILCEIFPRYIPFLENGKITVKLIRALYGCIESALLWYQAISSFLIDELSFTQSQHDECLFFKGTGKDAIHIAVYVDDFFISAPNQQSIREIESKMKERFRDITFNYSDQHEYLGARYDLSTPGVVSISMQNKIKEILKEFNINKTVTNPAANHLMEHRELSTLPPEQQESLRSGVVKLLYKYKTRYLPSSQLLMHSNQ
jgi:hypothetical protein